MSGRYRYLIVGAGGVGGAAAVLLQRAGHDVLVVARGAHAETIAEHGLLLRTPDGEVRAALTVTAPDQLEVDRDHDVILLAVKAHDTAVALNQIVRAGGDGAAIVCAQNGVANEPATARTTDRVGSAMIWTPAVYLSPGVIECYATPSPALWILGAWPTGETSCIDRLGADLDAAGLATSVVPDVSRYKYAKLLDNLGNAVDALCTPGEWGDVLAALRAEGEACLRAAGIEWVSRDELEAPRVGRVKLRPIGAERRPGGSTWQSLARGSAGLELEYLNGEVCMLGAIAGVPTPYNRAVLRAAAHVVRTGAGPRSVDAAALQRFVRGAS